jgi:hypothetical protein
MHRLRTQIAARCKNIPVALPIASMIEKFGVIATYRVHDLLLSNPASRKRFTDQPPRLTEVQTDVVRSLRQDGCAVALFDRLVPDERMGDQLRAYARLFTERTERELAEFAARVAANQRLREKIARETKHKKDFNRRRYGKFAELNFDDPWLRLGVSPWLLNIVNSYLDLQSKLIYTDQWYTVPNGAEAERIASQRWHRDYNDKHLVKVFIYLEDVDETAGPFEYVPGSARGGRYAQEWPWRPLSETYPPAEEFERRIQGEAVKTFTGPAGTMIFCNTSGFHRGGFATHRRRVMWVYNYVSPAGLESLCIRNFRVDPAALPPDLSPEARFALT